jgi:DHA1 family bicyclomycin/chloramphenicol resistance-like MFS transporter
VAALAPSVEVLIAARFVQALAGAAGMVLGRAIISDVAVGREAARAFSLMMMVVATAPIVAPIAGSLLATSIGWRGILWAVFAATAVMLVAGVLLVPESHPRERRAHARALNAGARPVVVALRSRAYVGNTLAFALSFGALMAYMSASPFVFQVMAGLSPVAYGVLYGVIALVLVASSAVSARLTAKHAVGRLLGLGLTVLVVSTLTLLALVLAGVPAIWFAAPIVVADASMGLILGNASSLALGAVPHVVGTASAILGTVQFALGAAVTPLVSISGETTAVPLAIIMATSALLACAAFLSTHCRDTATSLRSGGQAADETASA